MGANKTYQQKGDRGRMLGESDEFRRLRHAVEKAAGDRERTIRNVCRLPFRLSVVDFGALSTNLSAVERVH
jgi:hypothetical protein